MVFILIAGFTGAGFAMYRHLTRDEDVSATGEHLHWKTTNMGTLLEVASLSARKDRRGPWPLAWVYPHMFHPLYTHTVVI